MSYIVGYNTPGYLPEGDTEDFYVYDSEDEAKRDLIEIILNHADHADEGGSHSLAGLLSIEAEDLNLSNVSQGYSVIICDPDREHDLGTCYWIAIAEAETLPYDNPDDSTFWQR